MSPALEGGCMGKRSCLPAGRGPCSPEPGASELFSQCAACTRLPPPPPSGWAVFAHGSGVHMAVVACCGLCLLPVTSVGQSGATLGLSWVRPGVWQSCRLLLCTVPRDTSTGGQGPQSDQLSAASPLLGPHSVCAVSSPLPGQGVLWSAARPYGGSLHRARSGMLLWRG